MEQLFAMRRIPSGLRRLYLHAAKVSNDLPDLVRCHAHALLRRPIRRHRRAWHTFTNRSEQIRIRISVLLLRPRQIRAASSTPRSEPVAKGAIRPKLELSLLRRLRIIAERVLLLSHKRPRRDSHGK